MTILNSASLCQALGQLIAAIAATESESEVYNAIARYLPSLIPSDLATIAIINPGHKTFQVFALGDPLEESDLSPQFRLKYTNNVGRCFISKAPFLRCVSHDEHLDSLQGSHNYHQVMSAPLIVNSEVIGTINLGIFSPSFYDLSDLELLNQITTLVVTNLERHRLRCKTQLSIERHRLYAQRLEFLNEMGRQLSSVSTEQDIFNVVSKATQQVLSADWVSYAVVEPEGRHFQAYPLLGGDMDSKSAQFSLPATSVEDVLLQQRPRLFPDLEFSPYVNHHRLHEQGLRQACSTPVRVGGNLVGVLTASVMQAWDYPEESLMLLSSLGRFMGTTMERIQVQKEVDTTLVELEHQASHDDLTGLPNRSFLHQELENELEKAQASQQPFSVIFVDLDRFKEVNDSLSHSIGDQLLCAASRRMRSQLRPKDLVARTGGDEFVILLKQVSNIHNAANISARLLKILRQPFHLEGHQIQVGGSIGISCFPEHGTTSAALMKHADIAMYAAKQQGRNNFQFYDQQMSEQLNARLMIENDLGRAIAQKEFRLFFQPQFDLESGQVVGVEALIRWQHPTQGMVSPKTFIEIAEESGLIGEITAWVLSTGLMELKSFHSIYPDLYLSVNVSAQELSNSVKLNRQVETALAQSDLPGKRLELELTERSFLDYPQAASSIIQAWKKRGIRLAIDDFGTGFSSLNYLLNLSIDTLKIDRSFIQSIQTNQRKQGVVKTILALGTSLGATCVAEGVEEQDQLDFLRSLGCQKVQGFLLAKPMTADQFNQFLHQHKHQFSKPYAMLQAA